MKIVVNDDKSIVTEVTAKLKENDGYCPCSLQRTDDTKCMCKDFREQQFTGECHCGLYVKIV